MVAPRWLPSAHGLAGTQPVKALIVAGARPNFMKIAPILQALSNQGHSAVLVHTGQHYDSQMSDAFFRDLGLPEPDFNLGVGGGSHAAQTARIMEAFEPVLLSAKPDWLVVVGDVNSTLACALVASKLRATLGCRIAHVEAGLRSRDRDMPEEINRILTDQVSDLLLTPSEDAGPNLLSEGISGERIAFVGNVMIDTLYSQLEAARRLDMPSRLGLRAGGYALSTLHRPSNVDDRNMLEPALQALSSVGKEMPVVIPLHPRTRANIQRFGLDSLLTDLHTMDPLSYVEMLSLTAAAAVVLTDSGGLQEETTVLGVPCVTLREQTERPVTLSHGTNRLAAWPLSPEGVMKAYRDAINDGRKKVGETVPAGWDGRAAERIVQSIYRFETSS